MIVDMNTLYMDKNIEIDRERTIQILEEDNVRRIDEERPPEKFKRRRATTYRHSKMVRPPGLTGASFRRGRNDPSREPF